MANNKTKDPISIIMEYAHYICSGLLLVFVIAYYAEKLHAEKKRGDALLENVSIT
jgi:hypothetical protein